MTIKDIKDLINKLESEQGNIDNIEVFAIPYMSQSVEVVDMGIINDSTLDNKKVFGIFVPADFFNK